jgi:hypothetical protein
LPQLLFWQGRTRHWTGLSQGLLTACLMQRAKQPPQ